NAGEVWICVGLKLVEHDADHWQLFAPVVRRVLVAFADHQLEILQQDAAERGDGARVPVGIEGDQQNAFMVNDFVEREQIFIRTSDDRKLIYEKGHQFV